MSATDALPTEVVVEVFKNLNAKDFIKCREVCWRWKLICDSISDGFWKSKCKQDLPDYEEAFRRSNLPWCDLYKSMTLWSKVSEAKVFLTQTVEKCLDQYTILQNSILSYPQVSDPKKYINGFNKIIYCDLNKNGEQLEKHLDCSFDKYAENDNIIVLEITEKDVYLWLIVISKRNNRRFEFGKEEKIQFWQLVKNRVYYYTFHYGSNLTLCYVELDENANRLKAQTLLEFHQDIIAISYINANQINVLAYDFCIYSLCLSEKKFDLICNVNAIDNRFKQIETMIRYGFKSSPRNIDCILLFLDVNISDLGVWCAYSKVVFIATGTPRSMLHIFYNPYHNGTIKLSTTPDLSIYMSNYVKESINDRTYYRCIYQINAVEIKNGHRLAVMYGSKIFLLNLNHFEYKVMRKRKINTSQ